MDLAIKSRHLLQPGELPEDGLVVVSRIARGKNPLDLQQVVADRTVGPLSDKGEGASWTRIQCPGQPLPQKTAVARSVEPGALLKTCLQGGHPGFSLGLYAESLHRKGLHLVGEQPERPEPGRGSGDTRLAKGTADQSGVGSKMGVHIPLGQIPVPGEDDMSMVLFRSRSQHVTHLTGRDAQGEKQHGRRKHHRGHRQKRTPLITQNVAKGQFEEHGRSGPHFLLRRCREKKASSTAISKTISSYCSMVCSSGVSSGCTIIRRGSR